MFLWILPSEVPCGVFYVTKQRLHLNSALAPKTHPQVGESSRSAKCVECIKMFAKSIFFSWKGTRAVFPAHYPRYHGSAVHLWSSWYITTEWQKGAPTFPINRRRALITALSTISMKGTSAETEQQPPQFGTYEVWSTTWRVTGQRVRVTLLLTIIHTFPWKAPAVLVESYYYSYYLLFFCPSFHLRRF